MSHQFLIATPVLNDAFAKSVIYLCEHNKDGAFGIVINRQAQFKLDALLSHLSLTFSTQALHHYPVLEGGPVQTERGFVLHSPEQTWASTLQLSPELSLTTSKDILEDIARNLGPQEFLVALGHAGWAAGQLEDELKSNYWLNVPFERSILFDCALDERWQESAARLCFDLKNLSPVVGHA